MSAVACAERQQGCEFLLLQLQAATCSPARAASIDAFNESMFVRSAITLIVLTDATDLT
jgi:hypothetical protein